MTSPALAVPTLAAQRRQVLRNDQLTVRSDLNGAQVGLEVGQAIPIVFGKRQGGAGGVWISPPATECRFENDTANQVTASYHLVLSDGQVGTLSEGDVYQGDTPLTAAEFEQDYDGRADTWTPGNFIAQRFDVTASSQLYSVEGKPIGGDSAGALDLGGLTSAEVNDLISDCKASLQVKSNGNYVTSFTFTVTPVVDWPQTGIQQAYKSLAIRQGAGSGAASDWSWDAIPWSLAPGVTEAIGASSPVNIRPGDAPRIEGDGFSYWFGVSNEWIYQRGAEGRYLPTASYSLTRPASTEAYGEIDVTIEEVIRPGFVLTQTATYGPVSAGLFGGLPGVRYDVSVLEVNSEPLPKPEATLYCGTGGTYAGLSTLSVTKEYPAGDDRWKRQVHAFIRNGVSVPRLIEGSNGASNQFPDLARRLMVASARVPAALIDDTQLLAAARFCAAEGLYCDGVVANPTNLREWLDRVAPMFLLKPSNRWGRMGLRPALPITTGNAINTGTITPVLTLDESNTIAGSFTITYRPRADRLPFAALVLWREQPEDDVGQLRSTEVRYAGQAIDGPFEEIDASEFVTREAHAMKAGAYRVATRRHVTHDATIQAQPTAAVNALMPGDIIRVNRARNPSIGSPTVWSYLYEVNTISGPPLGPWSLGLTHFPVDVDGRSLVARDVANAALVAP